MSDNNEMLNQQDLANPVLDEAVVTEAPGGKKPVKKDKPSKEKRTTGKETFSKVRAIIGVLLIVAAILTAVLLVPVLSGQETTYEILYAKVDVPAGVQITEENISTYFGSYTTNDPSLYASVIPAAQATAVLKNAYTARDIYAGKYPSRADFSATNLIYNDTVPAGYELIAINIQSMQSNIGYMPQAGDIIRFYKMVTYDYTDSDIYFDAANIHVPIGHTSGSYADVYPYLQYVEIFKVIDGDRNDADANGTPGVVYVVKVRSGVQALQLVEAAQSGNYYWSLVSSGDAGKAKALLELQDEIVESGLYGAGREEVLFSLEDLTAGNFLPKVNSTVRFAAAVANGDATALEYPGTLKYVTVLNIYDQNKVNMNLEVETPEGQEPEERKATYVGLNLTKEQAELLQKLIDEGQVFIKQVNETQDQIVSGFDAVNDLLWGDRAQAIMQQAGRPDIDVTEPETEAGAGEETPDATQPATNPENQPDDNAGTESGTETTQPDETQNAA